MRSPLGDYLRARRAQVTPEQVGLPVEPGRKVKGLRREEVAELAGISAEYYLRLEQGRHRQPSPQVVECLARALCLDTNGAYYLHRLVRLQSGPAVVGDTDPTVATNVKATLELWQHTPAIVFTSVGDVVFTNERAQSLTGPAISPGVNLVLMIFSEYCRENADDWEAMARNGVANLRWRANPFDPHLQEIVGLLSLRDPDFRRIWALHEAYPDDFGTMTFRSRHEGNVDVRFQNFQIPGTLDWMLMVMRLEDTQGPADAVEVRGKKERISLQ